MKLTQKAISNWQFSISIVLLVLIAGTVSFLTMPRYEDPPLDFAGTGIIVIMPGASPTDIEALVVKKIEDAINELENVKHLSSTIEEGISFTNVEFEPTEDPDKKYQDVVSAIEGIRPSLPSEIAQLTFEKYSSATVAVAQVALVSKTAPYSKMKKYAEQLKDELRRVPGVRSSDAIGFPEQEVRINFDREKMEKIGITVKDVQAAIQGDNTTIPVGAIMAGDRRFTVRTNGTYKSMESIRSTVVRAWGNTTVRVNDIATVSMADADTVYKARVNGVPAVFVTATQKKGTNIFDIKKGLQQRIDEFKLTLPDDISLQMVFDQSRSVRHRLDRFFMDLLIGIIIVGIVVFLPLGRRASVIIMSVIPVSILAAIGVIDIFNFGIDQISIVGLVIALGMIVDDAIVVLENITRELRNGIPLSEAVSSATGEVGWAVVSSTLTTVFAFLPMAVLNSYAGQFIKALPLTVIISLLASLALSLTITPLLTRKLFTDKTGGAGKLTKKVQSFVYGASETTYRNLLEKAVSKPILVLFIAICVFASTLSLLPVIGVSLFPKAEKPYIMVNIDTPQGSSISRTDAVVRKVESLLNNRNDVMLYASNIGKGNPRIYYNMFNMWESPNTAQILVETNSSKRSDISSVLSSLRNSCKDIPGAIIRVEDFIQGPPIKAPIVVQLVGNDLKKVKELAGQTEEIINGIPGVVNVNNHGKNERIGLKVTYNRDKMALLGVPAAWSDLALREAVSGGKAQHFRDSLGEEYDIVLRMGKNSSATISDLSNVSVPSLAGKQIPVRQIADIGLDDEPTVIERYKRERVVYVTADVKEGFNTARLTEDIAGKIEKLKWPEDVRYVFTGEQESRKESFGGLGQAISIALLAIFGLLVMQFRSFIQPCIVFAAIPFAISGALIGLFITGNTFSFTGFVGLTSLMGIVVKNSIILVDRANQLKSKGLSVSQAIIESGVTRFTPILITTLTTIGGLIPLAFSGSSTWEPLGVCIISGLTMSTGLTLIVVPVLYKILTR
jgi:multidrug efflux pump subunit AcrB